MPQSSPLSAADIARYIDFMELLAADASAVTMRYFRQPLDVINKKDGAEFDPVTIADREAETAIRARIAQEYPTHTIIGEEHDTKQGASQFSWIIDPIDGTRSFVAGVPLWATLIALNDGTKPRIGMMHQPYTGETFLGWPGGAELRTTAARTPLKTKTTENLNEAIVGCTDPAMFNATERAAFRSLNEQIRLRRFGGDSYFYCLLAAGFIDLVVEAGLQPYDIQALIPIIEGAGGIVTNWRGGDPQQGGQIIAAANGVLHAKALDLLKPAALT